MEQIRFSGLEIDGFDGDNEMCFEVADTYNDTWSRTYLSVD